MSTRKQLQTERREARKAGRCAVVDSLRADHAATTRQQGSNYGAWRPTWWRVICIQELCIRWKPLSAAEPAGEWTRWLGRVLCVGPCQPCRRIVHPRPPSPGHRGQGTGFTALHHKVKPSVRYICCLIWLLCWTFSTIFVQGFLFYFLWNFATRVDLCLTKTFFRYCVLSACIYQ